MRLGKIFFSLSLLANIVNVGNASDELFNFFSQEFGFVKDSCYCSLDELQNDELTSDLVSSEPISMEKDSSLSNSENKKGISEDYFMEASNAIDVGESLVKAKVKSEPVVVQGDTKSIESVKPVISVFNTLSPVVTNAGYQDFLDIEMENVSGLGITEESVSAFPSSGVSVPVCVMENESSDYQREEVKREPTPEVMQASSLIQITENESYAWFTEDTLDLNNVAGISADKVGYEAKGVANIFLQKLQSLVGNQNFKWSTVQKVVLPNLVQITGNENWFECNDRLTTVEFGYQFKKIAGNKNFMYCEKIEKLTMPGLLSIKGTDNFRGIKELKELTINSLLQVEGNAFSDCEVVKGFVLNVVYGGNAILDLGSGGLNLPQNLIKKIGEINILGKPEGKEIRILNGSELIGGLPPQKESTLEEENEEALVEKVDKPVTGEEAPVATEEEKGGDTTVDDGTTTGEKVPETEVEKVDEPVTGEEAPVVTEEEKGEAPVEEVDNTAAEEGIAEKATAKEVENITTTDNVPLEATEEEKVDEPIKNGISEKVEGGEENSTEKLY